MADPDCAVCCEPFQLSVRKRVDCGWCDFVACATCIQRFMLDLMDSPQCMNCKHVWNREFLESKFTKTFINGQLKKHREVVLFEIEKGLLPETQPFAEEAKQTLELEDRRKPFNEALKKAKKELAALPGWPNTIEALEKRKEVNIKIHTLKEEIKYLIDAAVLIRQTRALPGAPAESSAVVEERRAFIKPCPAPDCRGFLSTGWKCGLCSVKVCAKCHEIKPSATADAAGHVCKPENIATVEALAKDSKPCPKCGSMIQKIEGCSQMFHTPLSGGCGAVFDWNTLRLHIGGDGGIHNPHWYEYQRHMNGGVAPRNLGDIPCGGMPNLHILSRKITGFADKNSPNTVKIVNDVYRMHQGYNHNQYQVLPLYTVNMVGDNRDLRINYLLNRIDEKKFKQQVQMREKAREKKIHIGQILQMYQTAIADIMGRMNTISSADQIPDLMREIKGLLAYTDENLAKAATIYGCVKYHIHPHTYKLVTLPKPEKASTSAAAAR